MEQGDRGGMHVCMCERQAVRAEHVYMHVYKQATVATFGLVSLFMSGVVDTH